MTNHDMRSRSRPKEMSLTRFWRLRLGTGFIVVLGLAAVLAITAVLVVPKVWLSTPADFTPQIRISVIDMLQARSLAKSARSLETAGRPVEACQAWRSAIANNPGDLTLTESLIRNVLRQPDAEPSHLMGAAAQAIWLLRLSETNTASLQLAAQIFFKAGLEDEVWELLSPTNAVSNPDLARIFAITAFERGEIDSFHRTWIQHESVFKSDPELNLYRSAWAAVWGPAAEGTTGLDRINKACDIPALRILALRLKGMVAAKRLDSTSLDLSLKSLEEAHGDRLEDHVRSWLLHDYLGQRKEAILSARAYAALPRSNREAKLILQAWSQLGLDDLIADFSKTQLRRFQHLPHIWVPIASSLITTKRWDDLRSLASAIRSSPALSMALGGYVDFLDGLVELSVGHKARAEELFTNVPTKRPSSALLTFEIASSLIDLGYHSIGQDLLSPLESELGNRPAYWLKLIVCAHANRQSDLLLKASRKAHSLFPKNLPLANDYAAALLIRRQDPAEAVHLTMEVVQVLPSPAVKINHSIALIRNNRLSEASDLLRSVQVDTLSHEERSFWHLAQFESEVASGNTAAARRMLGQIDRKLLFPEQKSWLDRASDSLNRPKGS